MGVAFSKSPLERRNTVLRRSQRRSIHGIKSKADKITKDIKKFKGTEEDSTYIDLKARIEMAERDLKITAKSLQPQIRHIYDETIKRTELCYQLLEDKLKENQGKLKENQTNDDNDDVFVEEIKEEIKSEESPKPKTVELNVIQIEPIPSSPQINKRLSAMKLGVAVLPGSIKESLHRRTQDFHDRVTQIRQQIETLEEEISHFVGKKNGRYYNKIKDQLDTFLTELKGISTADEDLMEQIRLCCNYVGSCLTFLDEKADKEDTGDDDYDDVASVTGEAPVENNLSPRSMRATYI